MLKRDKILVFQTLTGAPIFTFSLLTGQNSNPPPVVSFLSPGLPSLTIARTVSSELLSVLYHRDQSGLETLTFLTIISVY